MSRRRRGGYGVPDPDGWQDGLEMVLKIGDITGDSDTPNHEGWIPILAWSWGMSRSVTDPIKPRRIRDAIEKKKKEILAAKGIVSDEEEEEENQDNESNGYGRRRRRRQSRRTTKKEQEKADALSDFDSDADEYNEFSMEEVKARKRGHPNIQDLSVTKYVDITSPDLYHRLVQQKKGIEITLKIMKLRPVREQSEEDAEKQKPDAKDNDSSSAAASSKDDKIFKTSEDDDDSSSSSSSSSDRKMEVGVIQEMIFSDCYITSVSKGGSGGESRLTENVTFNFSGYQLGYTDICGNAPRNAHGKPPSKSIYYDCTRRRGGPLDDLIRKSLKESDQFKDVQGIVMGYL